LKIHILRDYSVPVNVILIIKSSILCVSDIFKGSVSGNTLSASIELIYTPTSNDCIIKAVASKTLPDYDYTTVVFTKLGGNTRFVTGTSTGYFTMPNPVFPIDVTMMSMNLESPAIGGQPGVELSLRDFYSNNPINDAGLPVTIQGVNGGSGPLTSPMTGWEITPGETTISLTLDPTGSGQWLTKLSML
jgi:hypothetical protein